MKIQRQGDNATVTTFSDGSELFFSYVTPVAGFIPDMGYFRTTKKWSITTSKHINKYLDGISAKKISQDELDAIATRIQLKQGDAK